VLVREFFSEPTLTAHRHFEALRAFYHEGLRADEAAKRFGFSPGYFKKLRLEFNKQLKAGVAPFSQVKKMGPKKRNTDEEVIVQIVALRKQDYSIQDIRAMLDAQGKSLSLDPLDKILKAEGFAPLPKRTRRERRQLRVHDGRCSLRHYEGEVRQVIPTGHGRQTPAFLITNDFDVALSQLIRKYARRWLVEQEIAEQVAFFHINQPSSSIVVKVDFDLTMSLLAHNLFRVLTNQLPGFERCTVPTISRDFLQNGARVQIEDRRVTVHLNKKTHLPILFELPWMKKETGLSWMGITIRFASATSS